MSESRLTLPPGPKTPAAWQLLRYSHSPLAFLESCSRRYGDPFTTNQAGYGKFVMLASPEAVKDVFRGDSHALHSGEGNEFLKPSVGEYSVLVLDEEAHARQRQVLLPPFKGERMRSFFDAMRQATLEEMSTWRSGQQLATLEAMQRITLRVMAQVVLGATSPEQLGNVSEKVRRVLALGRGRYGLIFVKVLPIDFLQRTRWLSFFRRMQDLDLTLFALMENGRRTPREERPPSILADLLEVRHANGQPLAVQEIRDALVTLLFAGHDTTAIALAWILEQIVPRKEVVGAMEDELDRVTGGNPPSADQLNQLLYLDAVIREGLRVRTILPFVVRLTKAPFVAGGREYPAGIMLCPCSHLVHRREDLYPDPAAFRPERFLTRHFAANEWFPFGGGNRMCLGMTFALYEMKVVLSTLFATQRLTRPPGSQSHPVRRGVALAPHDGARLVVGEKK